LGSVACAFRLALSAYHYSSRIPTRNPRNLATSANPNVMRCLIPVGIMESPEQLEVNMSCQAFAPMRSRLVSNRRAF